jgi:hypothetical protein
MNQLLLRGARVASVGAALLFVSPQSFAQQDNQNPLRGLDLDARMLEQTFPGFMGSGSGYTSRFDPSFNPAMGLIIDSLATFSEERGEEVDQFDLRSVEINLASRIDPLGWAYLVAAFEEDEFELEEAVFIMDQLPANLSIRAGKMLADFGKWNTIHLHDKNYVFEDGVRSAFFGGNLNVTGVELHQWTGIGDVPVRWSLGVHSNFGGHGHGEEEGGGAHAHGGEFASGAIDNRGLEEFAFTGRGSAQQDFGANGFIQYGVSFFHTGEGLVDRHDINDDGIIDEEFGLGQTTVALDFTLRSVDAGARTADTFSVELWRNQRDGLTPADEIVGRDANGIWGFYQHDFSPQWGAGVQGAWWQDALTDLGSDWFTGAESGSQRAVFVTRNFSEFNRMRLQLTQDHQVGESPSWSLALQWDVILGSHSHPLDW